jgi:MFS family permease
VLNASIVLLFVFNLACSFSRNTTELLLFRFLGGMAGAPPLSVGAGTLADLFNGEERSTPLALFSLGPTLGPIISPVMSGWILEYTNSWRWVFWTLTIMNGVIALLGLIFVEETYVPVLLARKAKKLIKKTGNPNLHTIFQMVNESLSHKIMHAISRPITMLVTHPIVFGLGLYMAFMYGFMYLMLVTFPNLWTEDYHYSVGIAGTMYVGLGVGYLLGMVLWIPYTQRGYLALTAKNNGTPTPEFRIQLLPYLTVFLSAGLFWYGWSAEKTIAWIMPVIGVGLFGSALVPLFQCLQLYLIDMNTRYSASTVAAAAVFRSSFGFGFPLFGPYMYQQLGYGWSNTLCGIICLVLGIPFPIIVYRYGAKVRHWIDQKKIID